MKRDELIGRIYEAAVLGDGWPALLGELGTVCEAKGGLLFTSRQNEIRWIGSAAVTEDYEAFLAGGWADQNIRVPRLVTARHPGFVTDADMVSVQERATLPLYTEFLIPRGIDCAAATFVESCLGEPLVVTVEGFASIADSQASVPVLDTLRPHLARAAGLSGRLALERIEVAATLLDIVGMPAVLLGSGRRVLRANQHFEREFGARLIGPGGRLACGESGLDRRIEAILGRIGHGPDGGASLPLRAEAGGLPAILHFCPITGVARDFFSGVSAIMTVAAAALTCRPAT